MSQSAPSIDDRTLTLSRVIKAPRTAVWRCWTEPDLLVQWFTPPPWRTLSAELDVRPGGSNLVVMGGPDGQEVPHRGIYLDVVPQQRLVLTDAYVSAWVPSANPFSTVVLTLSDAGPGETHYDARVLHWTSEAREQHETKGFHEGWGQATRQLEALAQKLD